MIAAVAWVVVLIAAVAWVAPALVCRCDECEARR